MSLYDDCDGETFFSQINSPFINRSLSRCWAMASTGRRNDDMDSTPSSDLKKFFCRNDKIEVTVSKDSF